ncbi:MAG: hypothetical protein JRF62_06025 [Deltaproteobacteria bacterium]|nr:hypothetical protein [Deltaproteobacteria bacterium]
MMEYDQRSAFAEKLWGDKEVASCSIGIAASFLHTVSWPISRRVPSRL